MSEKIPCPTCERPMKPRHTKGTDFMPRHSNPQGERCSGTGSVVNAKPRCEDCGETSCYKLSDPAPTVEPMETRCDDDACPCGGDNVPLHELHAIGYTGVTEDNHSQADPSKGPWFGAMYDGFCSVSLCKIAEGDRIRADGQGGYECEDCGDTDLWDTPETQAWDNPGQPAPANAFPGSAHPYAAIPDPPVRNVVELRLPAGPGPMPVPDEFEDPTAPADVPDVLNVSGQPKARYQWRGSQNMGYLIKDPTTGDFRRYKNQNPMGWTRATTFNKAASSTTSLTAWKLRNVIIGAARRPDALLRAHGLTHKDARQLDQIAADLEEVAGAKVGSDIGTFLHEFTEHMDAGLKTWRDAPPQYQAQLALYAKTLADAGFEAVPGLIERTTCITEFGGVVGTFDRVLYHRPSGTYAIGDLKTGKTMDYARLETECQEWIYAHGVNQNGVYDWNTDRWTTDWSVPGAYGVVPPVSEEWGLIIHMPVQGDDAGKVFLERADLQRGARYAETCAENRGWSRPKRELWSWEPPAPQTPEPQLNETSDDVWRALFRNATTSDSATALWKRAKETGVHGVFLNELIGLARESIRSHS